MMYNVVQIDLHKEWNVFFLIYILVKDIHVGLSMTLVALSSIHCKSMDVFIHRHMKTNVIRYTNDIWPQNEVAWNTIYTYAY